MTPEHSTSTILVVEDEALPRLELIDTLSCAGYEVLEASNAHEALGYLQHQRQIDVVITDIQLGDDLTGWDVPRNSGLSARISPSSTRPAMRSIRLERSPAASFSVSPAGRSTF